MINNIFIQSETSINVREEKLSIVDTLTESEDWTNDLQFEDLNSN